MLNKCSTFRRQINFIEGAQLAKCSQYTALRDILDSSNKERSERPAREDHELLVADSDATPSMNCS